MNGSIVTHHAIKASKLPFDFSEVTVVTVGTDDRPATLGDLESFASSLMEVAECEMERLDVGYLVYHRPGELKYRGWAFLIVAFEVEVISLPLSSQNPDLTLIKLGSDESPVESWHIEAFSDALKDIPHRVRHKSSIKLPEFIISVVKHEEDNDTE